MKTKSLTLMAIMIAVIIILGLIPPIPIGFIPVPIILQNMGIILAGAILGSKKGFVTVAIFLLLAALGLPVLTGASGSLAAFIGPSAGYLWAYPFAAFFIGLIIEKLDNPSFFVEFILLWLVGFVFIDTAGAIGLSIQSHMPLNTALMANLVFLPGDSIKILLVTFIHRRLRNLAFLQA